MFIKEVGGISYTHSAALSGGRLDCLYFAGPLNINRQTRKADTVMGTVLPLDEEEFAALDMLVAQEGEWFTFEHLYTTLWSAKDDADDRKAAQTRLDNLIKQVRIAGEGFMWIECKPEAGYRFRTRWGHNWH